MKTLLVWDIENVPVKRIEEIFAKIKHKPTVAFAVSKIPVSDKALRKLTSFKIQHIKTETIADIKIKELLEEGIGVYDNFIIISSDTDFCSFSKMVDASKIQWILNPHNAMGVLKKNNITKVKHTMLTGYVSKKRACVQNTPKVVKTALDERLEIIADIYNIDIKYLKFVKSYEKLFKFKKIGEAESNEIKKQKEKMDFILKQIIHRISHFQNKRSIGVCSCCGATGSVTSGKWCDKCEGKYVVEFGKKSIKKEDRIPLFLEKIAQEKASGGIIFPEIDLLKKELEAEIHFPKKLL